MESFFTRYRNLVVVLAILVAQIAGLAVQVRRTSSGRSTFDTDDQSGVRLIRLWANAIIAPPERIIHASKLGAVALWTNYFDLMNVRRQNEDLEKTIGRLRLEQAALLEDARQGQRLQALLGFQQKYVYATVAAQAYGSSGSDRSHLFYIDKGAHDGLKPDMAVITADGIVGKVRDVFPNTAQVLAVNDSTSGAGVILESTRIRGILRGNAAGQLEVVDILADQRIHAGENVLTAGGDLIFPRGLPVGVVQKVVRDPDRDAFIDVIVTPAAHLNRLDEVLVITSTEPRFPLEQQQDLAVSDTLQGAVPPAIRDQLKASEIMAEKLPGLIDPNLPADQQPLHDSSNPNPVTKPPQPLNPDEFSPGVTAPAGSEPVADTTQKPRQKNPYSVPPISGSEGPAQPAMKSTPQTPQRDR